MKLWLKIVVIACFAITIYFASQRPENIGLTHFEDNEWGFAVDYPAAWGFSNINKDLSLERVGIVFYGPNYHWDRGEIVQFELLSKEVYPTKEYFMEDYINEFKSYPEFEIRSQKTFIHKGYPAIELKIILVDASRRLRDILILDLGDEYMLITYNAWDDKYEQGLPAYTQMKETLRLW